MSINQTVWSELFKDILRPVVLIWTARFITCNEKSLAARCIRQFSVIAQKLLATFRRFASSPSTHYMYILYTYILLFFWVYSSLLPLYIHYYMYNIFIYMFITTPNDWTKSPRILTFIFFILLFLMTFCISSSIDY